MNFSEYQKEAGKTAMYPTVVYPDTTKPTLGVPFVYPALGLAGEAGELANKVKKILRGDCEKYTSEEWEHLRDDLVKELGDVLWYVAALATDLGEDLEVIAERNLTKLSLRKSQGKIKGTGDNR